MSKDFIKAVKKKDYPTLSKLVASGQDVNADEGYMVKRASDRGDVELMQQAQALGADLGIDDNYALFTSIRKENYNVTQYLLSKDSSLIEEIFKNTKINLMHPEFDWLWDYRKVWQEKKMLNAALSPAFSRNVP